MISELKLLNSAFVRAPENWLKHGAKKRLIDIPVRYGQFRHLEAGSCQIDTGYTKAIMGQDASLPLKLYAKILSPRFTKEAMDGQNNLAHILISHAHADHISGLNQTGNAQVWMSVETYRHARTASRLHRLRHGVFAELLPADLEPRLRFFEDRPLVEGPLGLGPCRDIFGDGSVLAVPLLGHAPGHTGFVFPSLGPLVYAADAHWLYATLLADEQAPFPASLIASDKAQEAGTNSRLLTFIARGGKVALCHEPTMAGAIMQAAN